MSNNGGHLTVQYNLRWSEELRDKIAEEAKKNTRSMNQEIIARLEQSFEKGNAHETEMYLMNVMVQEQKDQIEKLQSMMNQLFARLERNSKNV